MQRSGRTLQLDICDYHNTVLCNLYDNLSDASGQATDVFVTTERNGWKELSFTIPSVCATTEGTEENYRLKYLIADYRLRLTDENGTDWYIISEPKVTHNALSKNVDVRAGHISQLLKNKQLDLEFSDDEGNNVGTAAQLLDAILDGTGWSPGVVETFDEDDGSGEKHRSLVAPAGTGAFKMITDMCELFEAKPVFNGDYTVDIRHMNPFAKTPEGSIPAALLDENGLAPFTILDQTKVLEILYGNNAKGITRTLNTENMITSLLAYGSYGDMKGMVSLQTVKHKEFTFTMDAYSSGTEFHFKDDEDESYYFTVDQNIADGTKLIWSKMDPASMSYVWNETTRHAYHVHESKQGEGQAVPITGEVSEVVNQMTRIMDFGYYEKVGLLTEEMFQEVAAYQRDVVPLYETSYTANQNFIQKLGELSDVGESNTGFLRLDVEEYKAVAEGVKITIKYTKQYPDGVMYRTDYMEKRKNFFPWRVATELKPNGDPVRGIGSVVLIVHNTNPVTYEKAYLRIIDNRTVEETDIEGHTVTRYADYDYAESEGVPKTITLWMDDVTSRLNKNTDRVYLFCTNSMMGYLGTQQVADESLVENMTNSLKESTVPHSVYFEDSRIGSIQTSVTPITSNPDGYGWLYRYNPANSNRGVLYFCYTKLNDNAWKRAYCQATVPSSGANGTYFYNTKTKKLYHRESSQWKLMDSSAEERIGASFSKVNYLCARRDMIYKGIQQKYTWTNPSSGSALIPGNYAILSPYDFYWSFTTEQNISPEHSIWVDTTQGCVYQDENISHVIEMMVKPFDLIDFPVENMLDDVTFTSGTINDLGVEVNSNSSVRSNTIRVYDTTDYEFLLPVNTKIFFYDVNQRFISKVDVIGSTQQVTQTPYQARNMRIVIPGAQRSGDYFRVKDYQKKFFANNTPYTILDPVTHDGIMKGVNNLTKTFADLADSAYMDYLPRSEAATKAISNKTKSMTDLLGDLYRESRWQDDSYVEGDEDKLYMDALKNLEQISRPEATYDVEFLDLYNSNRYEEREWPDITIDYAVHLIDPGIDIDLWAYIDKLNKCYDQPWKTTLELNTNLSMISQHSFTDIMTRIAEVAQEVKNKRGIYGRAEALTGNGTMLAAKLEGTINAYKNKIDGAASNWYTNDKGQIIIESIDGNYAMMLTGAGLMIANSRNEFGDWNWRTAATGDGITADEIVTGTLYARLIEAHGITVDKLHASVGQELEIGSNKALMLFATTDGFRPAGGVNTPANEGDSYIVIAAKDGDNPAHIDVKSGGVVNIEGSELNLSATGNDHSSINVNANSDINISNGGNINIESTGKLIVDSETFSINGSGDVSVKGEIKATSGFIGTDENHGFVITGNSIKNGKRQLNDDTRDGIYIGTDGIAVGNKNDGFLKITSDGTLTISIRKQDIQGLTTTYVQPTAPENPQEGDIWIQADADYGNGKTWNQLSNTKWNDLSGKTWNELLGAKQFVYDGMNWIPISDYGMQLNAETKIQQNYDAISLLATSQIENASQIIQNKAEIQVQSNRITSEVQRLENGIKTNSSAIEQTAQHIYSHVNDNYYGKESGILITADGIDIKSKDVSNVSAVKITPSGISLTAGKQIILSADDLILSGESYNSRISAVVSVMPKIFRQNDQPQNDASHTLTEGDLWYDTDNNNHLKRYNGTGWDDCDDTGKYAVYSGIVIDANGVYIKTSSSSTDNAISLERSGITLGTNKTLKVAASNLIIGSSDSDTLSAQVTKLSNLDTLVNTTGVPKVKATGMTVDGNTINLTSTGTMHILGNSSIVIGSNASSSAVKIDKDGIYLSTSQKLQIDAGNLQIDSSGNVTVTGDITANTGHIGGSSGWEIASGWLKSGSAGTTVVLNTGGGETDAINNYAMWAGATWPIAYDSQTGNAPFRLTKAGKIYATGVEISGKITAGANSVIGGWTLDAKRIHAGENSTYVALDSGTTSVNYAIWAGAESAASAPFSVTRAGALNATSATIKGTIIARSGKIGANSSDNGGWSIDENQISSGSGTSFVALNSDNSKTNNVYNQPYAIWVGNGKAANAPFRVGRDGTVYLTRLAVQAEGSSTYDFIDLSGNSSNVKYPLWKLNYYTVKSYSENSITLSNNATVNFNTAASALIYTSWDGGGSISSTPNLQIETRTTPTGTPINQRNISFSANSGTGNESPTSGKTITVNSFDANAKAKAWMNASVNSSTSRLLTVNIDASNLLSSVALSGSWSGNSSSGWTFTTTNTANSKTTATTIGRQFSPSSGWNASWKKQITITGTGQGLLYQWTEDASDAYDAGVAYGEAKFTEYTGQKCRVSNGNYRNFTLYYRTTNPGGSYSYTSVGTGFVQVADIADTLYTKAEEQES